ncbi:MAG: hypothetical protein U0835_14480 [Isosphaeraceae bacterium]
MTLDQSVALSIANRRVTQTGLYIPIGRLNRIGLDGSVDFDRNINLVASVPILPTGLLDKPVIGDIAATAVIRVPVRGNLGDPQVDRAFNRGMKEMGKNVLERSLTRAVPGLLDLITRLRDPNAPSPAASADARGTEGAATRAAGGTASKTRPRTLGPERFPPRSGTFSRGFPDDVRPTISVSPACGLANRSRH